jgi:hypothetical protein
VRRLPLPGGASPRRASQPFVGHPEPASGLGSVHRKRPVGPVVLSDGGSRSRCLLAPSTRPTAARSCSRSARSTRLAEPRLRAPEWRT